MSEREDHLTLLEALSRIHDLPPLRAVQPKAPKWTRVPVGKLGLDVRGQGRRSGGVLSLFAGEVFRW